MFGLGKRRSLYGKFLDRNNVKQEDVVKVTGLNRDTVSDICADPSYMPRNSTVTLLLMAARELTGKNVNKRDFWS